MASTFTFNDGFAVTYATLLAFKSAIVFIPASAGTAIPNVFGLPIIKRKSCGPHFLEEKSLVSVSGSAFGGDGHIRFSYAASMDDLEKAMDFVEETLNEI